MVFKLGSYQWKATAPARKPHILNRPLARSKIVAIQEIKIDEAKLDTLLDPYNEYSYPEGVF